MQQWNPKTYEVKSDRIERSNVLRIIYGDFDTTL